MEEYMPIKKYIEDNYVPKSKIKKKIDAYSKSCTVVDTFIVEVLKELLGEEE